MPKNIGPMIAASAQLGLKYAQGLTKGIDPNDFSRFAPGKDGVIVSNHPAFLCGHLSLYAPKILEELGHDPSPIAVPSTYPSLFSKDATCQNDVEGTVYPAMDELLGRLMDGYTLVAPTLAETEDEVFIRPNPNESLRSRFPTIGAAHGFYVGGHFMVHLGQWSAWRRAMGLGAT